MCPLTSMSPQFVRPCNCPGTASSSGRHPHVPRRESPKAHLVIFWTDLTTFQLTSFRLTLLGPSRTLLKTLLKLQSPTFFLMALLQMAHLLSLLPSISMILRPASGFLHPKP
ncbi:hypothetical protein CEXT_111061 [Caerostris extrusa]|uniref:Uncharacterized protein n=1 Tax=Caerostris extrusa TaxID=172846 RepID=A0AAV4MXB7_CAEEX|nr:hypothetical protein CEXT_111061 [Caerostris extrusa]